MGTIPSIPDIKLNFSSNCCNVKEEKDDEKDESDGTDLARPQTSSRFRRTIQTLKGKWKTDKEDQGMAERTDGIYVEQATKNTVPDETI